MVNKIQDTIKKLHFRSSDGTYLDYMRGWGRIEELGTADGKEEAKGKERKIEGKGQEKGREGEG